MRTFSRKRLEQANLQIVAAENRVDAQRALLARLQASGADTTQADKLLASLLDALEVAKTLRRHALLDLGTQAERP